jgi:hypothetical protein
LQNFLLVYVLNSGVGLPSLSRSDHTTFIIQPLTSPKLFMLPICTEHQSAQLWPLTTRAKSIITPRTSNLRQVNQLSSTSPPMGAPTISCAVQTPTTWPRNHTQCYSSRRRWQLHGCRPRAPHTRQPGTETTAALYPKWPTVKWRALNSDRARSAPPSATKVTCSTRSSARGRPPISAPAAVWTGK